MVVTPDGYKAFKANPSLRTPLTRLILQLSVAVGSVIEMAAVHDCVATAVICSIKDPFNATASISFQPGIAGELSAIRTASTK